MTTLTKGQKDIIVRSIMNDVPIENKIGELKQMLLEMAIAVLPKEIRKLYENKDTQSFVNLVHAGCDGVYCWVPASSESMTDESRFGSDNNAKFRNAVQSHKEELMRRDTLRAELKANFYSVRTVKQFTERFSELVKYLPEQSKAVANLPATTDLVDKLKNLGVEL